MGDLGGYAGQGKLSAPGLLTFRVSSDVCFWRGKRKGIVV